MTSRLSSVEARKPLAALKRLGEVGARGGGTDSTPRIHTPAAFRDLLLSIARSHRTDDQETLGK